LWDVRFTFFYLMPEVRHSLAAAWVTTISIPQRTAYFGLYGVFVSEKAFPIGHYCPLAVEMHLLPMKICP